jgi:hypothetical protein
MKPEADHEQLLNDVLAEAAPADFREAMLGKAVRLARGRRHSRQARRVGVLVVAVLLAALVWQHSSRQPQLAQQPSPRTADKIYTLIHNEPLLASAIVTTRILVGQEFASSAKVGIIETSAGNFRFINDEELLALVSPRPALLIRTGPHSEELVFANSEGQTN